MFKTAFNNTNKAIKEIAVKITDEQDTDED